MRPDVLVSDSSALALSDLQFVGTTVPDLKVVLISMKVDCERFLHVVRDGACVLQDASAMEVAAAIRSIAARRRIGPAAQP